MKSMSVARAPAGNEWMPTPAINLAAAGSTKADATVIPLGQDFSIFTTVSSGQGCILPKGVGLGEEYVVANHGSNALLVYPPSGKKMGTAAGDAAYSLTAGKTGYFLGVGQDNFTVNP
jgi:hypothetical protein